MKKAVAFLFSLLYGLILSPSLFSQVYYIRENGGNIVFQQRRNGSFVNQTAEDIKKIPVRKNLRFDVSGLAATTTFKIELTPPGGTISEVTNNASVISLANKQYKIVKEGGSIGVLKLTATPTGGGTPVVFDNLGASASPVVRDGADAGNGNDNNAETFSSWRKYLQSNRGGYLDIIKGRQRYFTYKNIAYICLDPLGNIIGKKPVNIDQDDDIIILMVVPNTEAFDTYSINDNDAEYAPSDLMIRPTEAIPDENIHSGEEREELPYTVKVFNKGPYTSSDVTFTAMQENAMLNNITVHVNPLYHLGLGVSYVSSSLENPDFQLVPLTSTTNTIKAANTGRQTILTINAIWYWWSTIRYIGGSSITRGRDVLKEPDFLTRFNPTFGVGLSRSIENNFFAGINFEFARGGSITAGWHYGKVSRLLDKDFKLGETEFTGTQADIKTDNVWKWGGFFGVTLDTRIFNRLFSTTRSNN
ncbi:hypothetical protein [Chitinophaga sp. S165]|uniref:hypothetical protein n=1 Tax=Chitinophaga sp. S165 TaxID=2135462 RepID=UPI000D70A3F0|nr:hypothetical protein [Chitinophaga sp. S165]PWV55595.1 hypothetical protein C7475_101101 [Chitinophaga sp. S165]